MTVVLTAIYCKQRQDSCFNHIGAEKRNGYLLLMQGCYQDHVKINMDGWMEKTNYHELLHFTFAKVFYWHKNTTQEDPTSIKTKTKAWHTKTMTKTFKKLSWTVLKPRITSRY